MSGEQAADAREPGDGSAAPLGGDAQTENELEADNAAEEETLKALDPDSASS